MFTQKLDWLKNFILLDATFKKKDLLDTIIKSLWKKNSYIAPVFFGCFSNPEKTLTLGNHEETHPLIINGNICESNIKISVNTEVNDMDIVRDAVAKLIANMMIAIGHDASQKNPLYKQHQFNALHDSNNSLSLHLSELSDTMSNEAETSDAQKWFHNMLLNIKNLQPNAQAVNVKAAIIYCHARFDSANNLIQGEWYNEFLSVVSELRGIIIEKSSKPMDSQDKKGKVKNITFTQMFMNLFFKGVKKRIFWIVTIFIICFAVMSFIYILYINFFTPNIKNNSVLEYLHSLCKIKSFKDVVDQTIRKFLLDKTDLNTLFNTIDLKACIRDCNDYYELHSRLENLEKNSFEIEKLLQSLAHLKC